MKKISVILILGLLLTGNAYAKKDILSMLEECTDDRYVNKTIIEDFPTMLYLVQPKYQELQKKYKSIKEKKKETLETGQLEAEYEKWEKDNPKPIFNRKSNDEKEDEIKGEFNLKTALNERMNDKINYNQYKIVYDEWFLRSNNFKLKIFASFDGGTKEKLKIIESKTNKFIRSQASQFLKTKNFDLKLKTKEIIGYLDHFTICEKYSNEAPISFELKWDN
jgi:hypothetical protein